eukprot:scaffold57255_cov51-Phaeocystis_antarctica.AAC.1
MTRLLLCLESVPGPPPPPLVLRRALPLPLPLPLPRLPATLRSSRTLALQVWVGVIASFVPVFCALVRLVSVVSLSYGTARSRVGSRLRQLPQLVAGAAEGHGDAWLEYGSSTLHSWPKMMPCSSALSAPSAIVSRALRPYYGGILSGSSSR